MCDGDIVPVLQDERALETDGGDGSWHCERTSLKCTLKNG